MLQDLRYGLRMIRKAPGFTAIAVLSLALGIGANTALFSVVDAMLLKKLPVKEPERLALLQAQWGKNFSPGSYSGSNQRDPDTGLTVGTSFPFQTYQHLREQESALSEVFAFSDMSFNVNADGQAEVAYGQVVSGNYFEGLGVPPLIGRTISDEDDRAGASPVAVISYRYWQRRFSGDPAVIDRQIDLNNIAFTIVGVTPAGFDGTAQVGYSLDVTIPLAWEAQITPERSNMKNQVWWLRLMGRLKPGATFEQARADLETAFTQSVLEHRQAYQAQRVAEGRPAAKPLAPEDYPRLAVVSGSQGEMNLRQFYAKSLYLLLGVVGLVLLVACANVANLLLARATSRQKEIAVRLAMGAGRGRLVRQLLTESVLLAVIAGALGVLLAMWIKDGLLAVSDWGRGMNALNPALDLRVLGFTFLLSLLTGLLFGIAPAWRSTRVDLTPALKDSGRGSSAASRSWLSKSLIVAQVAVSLLLLIGAGLLLRTLLNLQKVEAGFNQQNLLLFRIDPGLIGYKAERLTTLYKDLSEHIEAVPGVRIATFSRVPLLSQSMSSRSVTLPGVAPPAEGERSPTDNIYVHTVRENFLEAMQIPLLAGRSFTAHDDTTAPRVAIVNQTFANLCFPDESPIGKRFGFDPRKPAEIEIIGLARDAKYARQRDDIPPTIYVSWQQELRTLSSATFEVRTVGEPTATVAAIRQAVSEVDGNLPIHDVKTQVEQSEQTLAQERLFAKLLTIFGLLAQQLAAIGLYGVMAYGVAQRRHEIGIRMALGATSSDVLKMILRQGMGLTLAGIALGIVSAYVLTKYLQSLTSMLYGVRAADPLTFAAVAVLLGLVAFAACYIPARRATRVDPMVALRYE
ncbi:MAG TPA: ABC transporter permease [Blastocatellia bacterium]|nr:ABC transporter permease [Blastocatellia bacterium]